VLAEPRPARGHVASPHVQPERVLDHSSSCRPVLAARTLTAVRRPSSKYTVVFLRVIKRRIAVSPSLHRYGGMGTSTRRDTLARPPADV
jgi:hypothetical protein